ncbi:MAG: hypothetical protein FJ194_15175 [Gammaproteobacteria bacterium]|nr:hypothetical protein [Gammaproteobacteria bacterium]
MNVLVTPLIFLAMLLSAVPVRANTPCPSDQGVLWHNCIGGTVTDERGVQYSGSWRDDVLHGPGEVIFPGAGRYVGTFDNGLKSGSGTYYWPDGSKFVGEFRNDVMEGRGVLYSSDGQVERTGTWRAGEFAGVSEEADTNNNFPAARVVSSPTVPSADCTAGPYIEPIDYASAEYIGNPTGRRARMCFYRSNGRDVTNLKFFPGGIFFMKSQTGSGGFAMGGAVVQSIRGTYGFDAGGRLNLRIAYSGTGVTQTVRGAGSTSSLDVSGRDVLETEFTLPNCQKITLRNETRRYTLGPALRSGRPDHLILEGERWELDSDCGDWEGWK